MNEPVSKVDSTIPIQIYKFESKHLSVSPQIHSHTCMCKARKNTETLHLAGPLFPCF